MKALKKQFLLFAFVVFQLPVQSKTIKRVLFIGNSYTAVNDLPGLVSKIAHAEGDSLFYDSNTPGGYTLYGHFNNPISVAKIAQGNWDYVALQAQSQEPAYTPAEVAYYTLPYARKLDSLIKAANSCTETVFYMTWGRKNGDWDNCPSNPIVCSYSGMQERLRSSYLLMAQQNNASVAPVGAVWKAVRNLTPSFDLYQSDESHPSIYGSYLAACVFYSSLFQKKVSSLSFTAGISASNASQIQQQSNTIVFDSLTTWFGNGAIPFGSFNYLQLDDTVQFQPSVLNSTSLTWFFGDGDSSSLPNPQHVYGLNGSYAVKLVARNNCKNSIFIDTINITTASVKEDLVKEKWSLIGNTAGIHLLGNSNLQDYSIEIFDFQGKAILSTPAKSYIAATLSKGIYIGRIHTRQSSKSVSVKFTVY